MNDLSADGLPPIRAMIEAHHLNAKKSLGQNFLFDLNLTGKIARSAGSLNDHDILEIGPGPGGLTRALLFEGARKIVAIERDERVLPILETISDHYPGKLQIISDDALRFNPLEALKPPIRIVANLPYNIGTELLIRWLQPESWPPFWSSMTLMLQKEVVDRIVAEPNSKNYGRLSLLVQWRANAKKIFDVPPQAFFPPPKVTSSIVHIEALPEPRFPADPKKLETLIATAFGQRRKMLRASLKKLTPDIEDSLKAIGISPTERAENIPLELYCKLSEIL